MNINRLNSVFLAFLIVFLSVFSNNSYAAGAKDGGLSFEQKVKMAYLYQFMKNLDVSEISGPIVLAIVGENIFGDKIKVLEKRKIDGKPIKIQLLDSVEDSSEDVQFLYFSKVNTLEIQKSLDLFEGKSIVTISDGHCFMDVGGMVALFQKQDRIYYSINHEKFNEKEIVVSDQMKKLAKEKD